MSIPLSPKRHLLYDRGHARPFLSNDEVREILDWLDHYLGPGKAPLKGDNGKSFIAMEYVQGETLKDKLAKGPLPLKEALETAVEIAEALETAHKQNIVHRYLKPANIMITPEGHVKVMDFGLAKRLVPAEGLGSQDKTLTASLTKTGATVGTLAYMSPEQLRGEEVDTRSDIFSLGVLLGVSLETRESPFKLGWRQVLEQE